jgi:sRNA-binding carbon storage regulator CsrA
MLVISRKENEIITIEPAAGLDPTMTLQQAFERGPIAIKLTRITNTKVDVAIQAPLILRIWRGEPVPHRRSPVLWMPERNRR